MLRDHPKVGPRATITDFAASSIENQNPALRLSRFNVSTSSKEPTLNASSRNNHSLFSFGGNQHTLHDDIQSSTAHYDFLPSVSFDDLQSSLTSATSDELELPEFSTLGGQRTVLRDPTVGKDMISTTAEARGVNGNRGGVTGPRTRAGSFLRRQSGSTRQSSISSTSSLATGTMDPPTAPLAMRPRRQSQYPPVSGNNIIRTIGRKSISSGVVDSDGQAKTTQRRRPSLISSAPSQSNPDSAGITTRVNTGQHHLLTPRASKTKSLQAPSKQAHNGLATLTMTPDHSRSTSFASPGKMPKGTVSDTPPSLSKRMSIMPGMPTSTSHATGLGARTVSPTDARRMKRLSTFHCQPPLSNTSPGNPSEKPKERNSSRSPSMIPRKTSTPSSSRTTPDLQRKSYSSGLSINSNASYTSARTSTGSLQPRMPLNVSTSSRLPTPKTRNVHSSAEHEQEDVPPVPAIPKAYESPKDSPAETPFSNRKPSLAHDASSINSSSTNETPVAPAQEPAPESTARRKLATAPQPKADAVPRKKKNLQPLRLPPLNLLPLSTPTAAKVAALQENGTGDEETTYSPPRTSNKTPSTPMTASKASSFFSRTKKDDKHEPPPPYARAASTTHQTRPDSSIRSSAMPIPSGNHSSRQAVSPYMSSSLPKNDGEFLGMPRARTVGDIKSHDNVYDQKVQRLTGPRAQKGSKSSKGEAVAEISSPEELATFSSGTSMLIRRKLSLSWKRNASRNNNNNNNNSTSEQPPQPPKHDSMPPPKMQASVLTSSTLTSPSPSTKSTSQLNLKRRKTSVSSLSIFSGHDRKRTDSWTVKGPPKKEATAESAVAPSRPQPVMSSKLLSSKTSSTTLAPKPQDPWITDLGRDDIVAEEEMKKLGLKRKETEQAAKVLDALRKRATSKERVSPTQAIQTANLNIYERGEIVDYKDVYFCGTQNAAKHVGDLHSTGANFGYDDDRGDYSIVLGDHLSYRYEVVDVLGKGSFGQVVRCIDHKIGELVAVKIIRNKKRFHQQALVEVNILQKLREWDPKNRHSMVSFTHSFYFRGHLCISTELLDMNLYEFIKSNGFRGFSLRLIRRFTKQMLSSLLLLKQHKVIHCDLKPENILLAHPMHSEIKVIDFGSSCFENEKVYTYIQSRFYRSPEVILGMTYGLPIDMWSLGCILAELFTGYPIFPGENEQEQLACIMEVFGPPEKHLIEKSTRKKLFFDSQGKPRLTVSSKGRRRRPSSKNLQQVLKCDDEAFLDFLSRCLRWDPDRRLKPEEAVCHEYITGQRKPVRPYERSTRESPIKRLNTITGSNRPLPEPPVLAANRTRTQRDVSGTSPTKGMPKRPSNMNGNAATNGSATSISNGTNISATGSISLTRRTSLGPALSGLPRVASTSRNPSGNHHPLAFQGATAAMNRKQ